MTAPHLDFAYKYAPELRDAICSVVNIDDALRFFLREGIDEIRVNREQMLMAAMFFVANSVPIFASKEESESSLREVSMKILKEGKLDMLFGVKLILETPTAQLTRQKTE